ncbi:hypothetical protein ACFQHW_11620 [Lapidilactobacillus achengensis]|uniref:Uncharacterized protein n=1 Tax=Lapidilactobacillus achengensis TaxID=2486000 RepID=A0ABW1UTQ7_9LACO|nr:hypothetical protein [Lapidilactobacillus achengensis]
MRTGTWWASFEANPQARRLVFKSSLVLSGKAAKDNFTTETCSPPQLLPLSYVRLPEAKPSLQNPD